MQSTSDAVVIGDAASDCDGVHRRMELHGMELHGAGAASGGSGTFVADWDGAIIVMPLLSMLRMVLSGNEL